MLEREGLIDGYLRDSLGIFVSTKSAMLAGLHVVKSVANTGV
jgi:hypothetical protein